MVFSKEVFIDGTILLINKPLNWTSFQVVNKIRWLIKSKFNIKKIKVGHAGTLDPLAEGLLIICTGKMTKKISEFQNLEKEYSEEVKLGLVKIIPIPDIESVNYGRGVGYEIIEHIPPSEIGEISATSIREKMRKDGKL